MVVMLWGAALAADWTTLPAFEASPADLLAASRATPASADARLLLSETTVTWLDVGRRQEETRLVYVVDTPAGVSGWGMVGARWSSWYQDRPVVEARVIAPDGRVERLDPSQLAEASGTAVDATMVTDQHKLQGPLPRLVPGSVVEERVIVTDRRPYADGARSVVAYLVANTPPERSRVRLIAPTSIPLTWRVDDSAVVPVVETKEGRTVITVDQHHPEGAVAPEPMAPGDIGFPRLTATSGRAWGPLAASYARIVDEALAGADLAGRAAAARGALTDPRARAEALLREAQKIRYVGLELGERAVVPARPSEVLARGYGDCKDVATLLVGLLRADGFKADVALLRVGPGTDVAPDAPGLESFSHAIVHTSGPIELWIDPTSHFAHVGELPTGDEARWALIANAKTKGLVQTPRSPASANTYRAVVDVVLPTMGQSPIHEERTFSGWIDQNLRAWWSNPANGTPMARGIARADARYASQAVVRADADGADDLSRPLRLSLDVDETAEAWVGPDHLQLADSWGDAFGLLPSPLLQAPDPKAPRRAPLSFATSTNTIERRVSLPDGYVVADLPGPIEEKIGPVTWRRTWTQTSDRLLTTTIQVIADGGTMTAAEVEAFRQMWGRFADAPVQQLRLRHAATIATEERRIGDALAIRRAAAEAHPGDGTLAANYALALSNAGFGAAARTWADRAAAAGPDDVIVQLNVGRVFATDADGRLYRHGFDRARAIAQAQRAIAIAPDNAIAYADLARAQSLGDDGGLGGPGSDPAGRILTLQQRRERTGEHDLDFELGLALARSARWTDLGALTADMPAADDRWVLEILAVIVTDGRPAGLAAAARVATGDRYRALCDRVSAGLVQLRRYGDAAAFTERAAVGAPDAIAKRDRARTLAQTVPWESRKVDLGDPAGVPFRLLRAFTTADAAAVKAMLSTSAIEDAGPTLREELDALDDAFTGLLGPDAPMDLVLDFVAAMPVTVDGDAKGGWRVVQGPSDDAMRLYVVREKGEARLRAFDAKDLGTEARARLERGDLETAKRWLGWAWDGEKASASDDPFVGSPFARVWRGGEGADAARMALAAALLEAHQTGHTADALARLDAARPSADPATALQIDRARGAALAGLGRWAEAHAVAEALRAAHPDAAEPLDDWVASGRMLDVPTSELRAPIAALLARRGADPEVRRVASRLFGHLGLIPDALSAIEPLLATADAKTEDFASAAWLAHLEPAWQERGVGWATTAAQRDAFKKSEGLIALSAALVGVGQAADAHDVRLSGLEQLQDPHEKARWTYLHGRIAEAYGLDATALALYDTVGAPAAHASAIDPRVLASERAKALRAR